MPNLDLKNIIRDVLSQHAAAIAWFCMSCRVRMSFLFSRGKHKALLIR